MLTPDKNLNSQSGGIQADGIFHIHGDLFIGKFSQDAGAAAGPYYYRFAVGWRNIGAEDARVSIRVSACSAKGMILASILSRPVVGPWK